MMTVAFYDLTGSSVYVDLDSAGDQTLNPSTAVYMELLIGGTLSTLTWLVQNGSLIARSRVQGAGTVTHFTTAYVAATHRYLRIREAAGTTFWDSSTDGSAWTNRHSMANPIAVTSLLMKIGAGHDSAIAVPGSVYFGGVGVVDVGGAVPLLGIVQAAAGVQGILTVTQTVGFAGKVVWRPLPPPVYKRGEFREELPDGTLGAELRWDSTDGQFKYLT